LIAACLFAVFSVARAELELSAFASVGGEYRFLLTDAELTVSSGWLSLGDKFQEHRISRFSSSDEVLTLVRDDESVQLRLKQDSIEQTGVPRRRVLDDGGAAEKRKREIPIWIDAYGNVAFGATAVTFDEIEVLFRRLAKANARVEVVFVHAPLAPKENLERMRSTKNRGAWSRPGSRAH
jgi:hypothetical protein